MNPLPSHPVAVRAFARAEALGSQAKTLKGVLRFAKSNPKEWSLADTSQSPKTPNSRSRSLALQGRWKKDGLLRKSDPDVKRARKDPKFRKNLIAKAKRRIERLSNPSGSTVEQFLEFCDDMAGRKRGISAALRDMEAVGNKPPTPRPLEGRTTFLGPENRYFACRLLLDLAHTEELRRFGATIRLDCGSPTVSSCWGPSRVEMSGHEKEYKAGRGWRTVSRAERDNHVRFFVHCELSQPRLAHLCVGTSTVPLLLPLIGGWRWSFDSLGVYVVDSQGREFHPTSGQLLRAAREGTDLLVGFAETEHRVRTSWAESVKPGLEGIPLKELHVCFADSRSAGNCAEGSKSFARVVGIDPARHVPASLLVSLASKLPMYADRAVAAVRYAWDRYCREMAQGFSDLSYHRNLD